MVKVSFVNSQGVGRGNSTDAREGQGPSAIDGFAIRRPNGAQSQKWLCLETLST